MTEADYIRYFEGLAERHRQLRHSPGGQRFFYDDDDSQEALNLAFRSRLHLPCLVLDSYGDELLTENDNFRLVVTGGFSVLCKAGAGDLASRNAARQEARLIAQSILKRLRRDCLKPTGSLFFRKIRPDLDFEGSRVEFSKTAVGWAYNLRLMMPTTIAATTDDWDDEVAP